MERRSEFQHPHNPHHGGHFNFTGHTTANGLYPSPNNTCGVSVSATTTTVSLPVQFSPGLTNANTHCLMPISHRSISDRHPIVYPGPYL
ncbi:hypothetical protein EX30DRAFT_78462 [Ascodesmis nigricans]|uniref:Uncharacterized protein n=1 Tax=Ascodesmis nigricans TaxID=341454 RepID=A0A4S2MSX3_9PEZI|nr:hypothetical protein EX30DRAFT_78462 [Ascodesmis nigricans]